MGDLHCSQPKSLASISIRVINLHIFIVEMFQTFCYCTVLDSREEKCHNILGLSFVFKLFFTSVCAEESVVTFLNLSLA